MEAQLHHVPVTLTQKQAQRLLKGHTVQLKADQIKHGVEHAHKLALHPLNAKRILNAAKKQKGCRLSLSEQEIMSGGSLFGWLKDAGKWVKSNIIDSKAYQQIAKPVVRQLVNTAVDNFVPAGVMRDTARDATNYIGEKTSAFGLKQKKCSSLKREIAATSQSNYSPLIGSDHPANNPAEISLPAPGMRAKGVRKPRAKKMEGSSFLAS